MHQTLVLDTCALLAWLLQDVSPPPARRLCTPSVCWCEIAWKQRLGKLVLPGPRAEFMQDLDDLGVQTVAIDRELFLAAVDLDWQHRDPADRLVVALAQRERAPVVTCDRQIQDYVPDCVWGAT